MDKNVIEAVIKSISKEEIEKHLPEIRRKIQKEVGAFVRSKSCSSKIRTAVEDSITDVLENDFHDFIDNRTVNRVITKTVNKIVGK